MSETIEQFKASMALRQVAVPESIEADGKIHRCDAVGRPGRKDVSYLLHIDGFPVGGFQNFRDGLGWEDWHEARERPLTATEEARMHLVLEAQRRAREAETQKRHEVARAKALAILAASQPATAHFYLEMKQIRAHEGVRLHHDGRLAIPMRDTGGRITTLQFIDGSGQQCYLSGGEKQGSFFMLDTPGDTLCIAEGYAAAASINESCGFAVAMAGDTTNLKAAAKALRGKYPNIRIVLCADDNWRTEGNPGIAFAREAALAVGGLLAVPAFGACRSDEAADFNDLMRAQGPEAVRRCIDAAAPPTVNGDPAHEAANPLRCHYNGGHFEVSDECVAYVGTGGGRKRLPPLWMCSRLEVAAMTRDAKGGDWGRLLRWRDMDGAIHQWAIPMELLQSDGAVIRRELARLGLSISPGRKARDLLSIYLQVWPVETRARCVDRLGWHGAAYVTPAQSFGEGQENVVFQNRQAREPAFSVSGTAQGWRDSVAALAAGNSRLVFALCTAFAGPLVALAGEDAIGFHLRGKPSSGKSTIMKAAASVWGNPGAYPRSWGAAASELEVLTALHHDGLLILDDISQADPKDIVKAAYLLASGQGKVQGSRAGMSCPSTRWRLLFLSGGEESMSELMAQAGGRAAAGQEIRLAELNVGTFEELHGQCSPAEFAQAVKDASGLHYGAVGIQWLQQVVADRSKLEGMVAEGIGRFVETALPVGANGSIRRVVQRFGLVAVAGELATRYGLTGWQDGEATRAMCECFASWLEGFGGTGTHEEYAMLSQVRTFIELHGSGRFENMGAAANQRIPNRVGFKRTNMDGTLEYLVLPKAFKREVCVGFNARAVTAALAKAGWLERGKDGKAQQLHRLPGLGPQRCYALGRRMWTGE